jgi:hypothetical protein
MGDGGEAFGGGLREGVVFATCRLGQAVEGVVGEGLGGVGVGVVEKDAGLGEVADPGDVADGVVVVAEILDAAEIGIGVRALGVDPADPEGGGIVLEVCKNVIGGVDAHALAAGVVGDGGDDRGGGGGAADLDGEGRDQAAGAVALLGDALVGGGVGEHAAEGVVGPGGLKGLGVDGGERSRVLTGFGLLPTGCYIACDEMALLDPIPSRTRRANYYGMSVIRTSEAYRNLSPVAVLEW